MYSALTIQQQNSVVRELNRIFQQLANKEVVHKGVV
jgi:hypothetical protein